MPSRSQMDRLFLHVLGIEERLDDLEDEIRKLRKEQERRGRSTSSRRGGARNTAATAEATDDDGQ